ncbi:MAG: TerC family protein [Planctomycetaceae bacterium]
MEFADLFDWVYSGEAWVAFGTLVMLEIVLGIDNIIFISILAGKLPKEQQQRARTLGLAAAMITRIMLLFTLAWMSKLTAPLFTVDLPFIDLENGHEGHSRGAISGRDLILLVGGLFLIAKSTFEIHEKLEGTEAGRTARGTASFGSVIVQIMLLDIVFSLDSVITAVGMSNNLGVMVWAVIVAVAVMMFAARPVGEFVDRHPTVKMLALSFLLLIGFTLVIESFDYHVPKGYIYFAMFFSVFVEMLNLRLRRTPGHTVKLNEPLTLPDDRSST